MASTAPSYRPAPMRPGLAATSPNVLPLRAGSRRKVNARRDWARDVERPILARVLARSGISNRSIADAMGNDGERCGAEVRSGYVAITPGELALLFPLDVSVLCMIALLRERLGRELADFGCPGTDPKFQALREMLHRLDELEASLSAVTR